MDMELAAPPVERGPAAAAVVLTVNGEGTSLVIELPLEPAGELNGCGCAHLHLCRWLGIPTREVLD